MLAGVTGCRRSLKWGCRGRRAPVFKLRHGSHRVRGPCHFGVLFVATWLRQQERLPGRKGEKGLLLVGHEKVPHDFGLTGDHGGDVADGAGSLNHGLLLLLLR